MNKETKKKAFQYNQKAIDVLVSKYGLSRYFIKQSINGNRDGVTPDVIKKEYRSLVSELEQAENKTIDNFLKP